MKTLFNNLLLATALICSGTTFISCDDDLITSNILAGDWDGDFGMYYNYSFGHHVYTFNSYDTKLSFFPEYDYAKYGYGYQVDYYDYGPYEKIYHYFSWYVENQDIYMTYRDEVNLNTVIRRYRMTSDRFSGYFDNSSSQFCLHKIADYYNWNQYDDCGDYLYCDRYGWHDRYASASRLSFDDDESADTYVSDDSECVIDAFKGLIRFGNRFEDAEK